MGRSAPAGDHLGDRGRLGTAPRAAHSVNEPCPHVRYAELMPTKPLAVRLLEQRGVPHELVVFDPAVRDAGMVAEVTGFPPGLVYKTLVIEQDPPRGKPFLVMAPSTREVDLKALAATLGLKRLRMATHRDAERLTGLRVGGISALALLGRGFPVLIADSALAHEAILVSAGERGRDIRLRVSDLVALTGARAVAVG